MFFSNPLASALEFLIFLTVNGTTQNYLFEIFLNQMTVFVMLITDDRI